MLLVVSDAEKCLSFSTSSWSCDLTTSIADRVLNAFKAFRNMSQEHFISLCLTDQGENFTVHCTLCWNMWHRRHCWWLEDRGWLGWELVKVLGCTWKITPQIFYWLSVSPWKKHPQNYCSVPHILHVWYICFFFYFYVLPIFNAGSSGWTPSLAEWLNIAWGNGRESWFQLKVTLKTQKV